MTELDRAFHRYRETREPGALGAVYDRIAPDLLLIATHLLRDSATAEDAVQATFLALMRDRSGFDPARPVRPWVIGILANQARLRRRAASRNLDPKRIPGRPAPDPLAAAEAEEFVETVTRSIDRLPEVYRAVMRLRLGEGLAPSEIAQRLGRSASTVRSQLTRGLEQIRRILPPSFAASVAILVASEARAAAGRAAVLQAAAGGAATANTAELLTGTWLGKAAALAATSLLMVVPIWIGWSSRRPALDVACAAPRDRTARAPAAPEPAPAETHRASPAAALTAPPAPPVAAPSPPNPVASTNRWLLTGITHHRYTDGRPSRPIGHCDVDVHLVGDWTYNPPAARRIDSVRSDEAGRFTVDLEALKALNPVERDASRVLLFAHRPGYVSYQVEETELPVDPSAPLVDPHVELHVDPGAVLQGRVVDRLGRRVRRAFVGFAPPDDPEAVFFNEEPVLDGFFRIAVHARETVYLRAAVPGLGVSDTRAVQVTGFRTIDVPDLVLREGAVLEGTAAHADGSPAAGLHLDVRGPEDANERGWFEHCRVVTDRNGRFRVAGLADGEHEVTPVFDLADVPAQHFRTNRGAVRYRVEHPCIVLRVQGSRGEPLPGTDFRMMCWPAEHADEAVDLFRRGGDLHVLEHHARFFGDWRIDEADGTFSIVAEPGSFLVFSAHMTGAEPVQRAVRVVPDRHAHDVSLVLREARHPGRLRIRLTDAEGRPVPLFHVRITDPSSRTRVPGIRFPVVLSDRARSLGPFAPGRYRLTVTPARSPCTNDAGRDDPVTLLPVISEVEVRPGENDVTLQARAGARLEVVLPSTAAVPPLKRLRCRLEVTDSRGTTRRSFPTFYRLGPDGVRHRVERLDGHRELILGTRFTPGPTRLRFSFEGCEPVETVVHFRPGRLHRCTLALAAR